MRKVEQWRTVPRTSVHDLEDGLEVAIQIDYRPHMTLERQGPVALVPPPVWHAAGQLHGLAGSGVKASVAEFHRYGACRDSAVLVFKMMDVQRGTFLVRGKGAAEVEEELPVMAPPGELEDLPGVSVL